MLANVGTSVPKSMLALVLLPELALQRLALGRDRLDVAGASPAAGTSGCTGSGRRSFLPGANRTTVSQFRSSRTPTKISSRRPRPAGRFGGFFGVNPRRASLGACFPRPSDECSEVVHEAEDTRRRQRPSRRTSTPSLRGHARRSRPSSPGDGRRGSRSRRRAGRRCRVTTKPSGGRLDLAAEAAEAVDDGRRSGRTP